MENENNDAVRAARDAALEEAAALIESVNDRAGDSAAYDQRCMYDDETTAMYTRQADIAAIRALKSQSDQQPAAASSPVQAQPTEREEAIARSVRDACYDACDAGGIADDVATAIMALDLPSIMRRATRSLPAIDESVQEWPVAVLDELRGQIKDMQEAACTYGDYSKEAVRVALDGVIDAIDELAAPTEPANQPGDVRSVAPMSDAEAHKIIQSMTAHLQEWADANDLDDTDEEDFPQFSGECIRFLFAAIAAARPSAPELTNAQIRTIMHNYSRMHQPGHYSDTEFDCLQDVIGFARAVISESTAPDRSAS